MSIPLEDAEFWFALVQGLLALLLVICGWVFTRLITQVARLAEKLNDLERATMERHHQMQLEIERVQARLSS